MPRKTRNRKEEMGNTTPEPLKDALGGVIEEQQADDEGNPPIEDSGPDRVVYENAPDPVYAAVDRIMQRFHSELTDVGLTVGCTFARAGKNSEGYKPAVKLRGWPCNATIRKTTQKDRLNGAKDAQIIFDANVYEGMTTKQRDALIDHELTHLVLKREGNIEDGEIQYDDAGRPKLTMRLHDHEIGVFKEVIERHGKDSGDWKQVNEIREQYAQLSLWAEDQKAVA